MQTIHKEFKLTDRSLNNGFKPSVLAIPDPKNQINRLKISEFKSWSVCFGIISSLTGLLKFLQLGVTMEPVTSSLFFLSCGGLVYSLIKMIQLRKNTVRFNNKSIQVLN